MELFDSDCALFGKYILVASSTIVCKNVVAASLNKYTPDLCANTAYGLAREVENPSMTGTQLCRSELQKKLQSNVLEIETKKREFAKLGRYMLIT